MPETVEQVKKFLVYLVSSLQDRALKLTSQTLLCSSMLLLVTSFPWPRVYLSRLPQAVGRTAKPGQLHCFLDVVTCYTIH
jgi:hypothetical protein